MALVESYLLKEPLYVDKRKINAGSWLGEFRVDSNILKKQIVDGEFSGVSIGGAAKVENILKESLQSIAKSLYNPFEHKPRRIFDDVDVREISIVDYPANNQTIIAINKGASMPDIVDPATTPALEPTPEEVAKAKKKKEEKDAKKKKKMVIENDDESPEEEEDEEEEDIEKALAKSPPALKIFKAQQSRIASLEKDQEVRIKKELGAQYAHITKAVKSEHQMALEDALFNVKKALPKDFEVIAKALEYSVKTIKALPKMQAIGDSNPDDISANDTETRVSMIAKSYMEKDPKLTKEQAMAKVYTSKAYLNS